MSFAQQNVAFSNVKKSKIVTLTTEATLYSVLVGETINYDLIFNDPEGDTKYLENWRYIHYPDFFANPEGYSVYHNYNGPSYVTSFDKPGLYETYFKASDNPLLLRYSLWSEEVMKQVFAHRRPIAKPEVRFTGMVYDLGNGTSGEALDYDTYDTSYDPDFPDKLQDKKFRTRWSDQSTWTYGKRQFYNRPGYTLIIQEQVQDIHGAWSYWAEQRLYKASLPPVNQHKPTMTITYPNGTTTNPTIVQSEPLVKWNYYDQEGDPQERYRLNFYYNDTNELALQIEHWNSNTQYQVPTGLISADRTIRIEGQVYSKGVWSDTSNKVYFKIVKNQPPIAGFNISPPTIWEGDNISITSTATDPDNNTLSYKYTLKYPDGNITTYTTANPSFVLPEGSYSLTQEVTDTHGASAILTKYFAVYKFDANVYHTPEWDAKRIELGRAANVFFAGEEFQLKAETTSNVTAVNVIFNFGTFGTYSTNLTPNTSKTLWNGTLWRSNFKDIPNGSYTVRFEATYSGGTKVENVPIIIDGTIYDDLGVHRVK